MPPRRLIPEDLVARWEAELRRAVGAAITDMQREVNRVLRSSGHANLVAAGEKPAQSAGAAAQVWSDDSWRQAVNKHIVGVSGAVAASAVVAARKSIPASATYGMDAAATEAKVKKMLVDRAIASGAALGERLDGYLLAAPTPAMQVASIVQFWNTAADITGDLLGASANTAGGLAEADTTAYATSQDGTIASQATRSWVDAGDDRVRDGHHSEEVDDVGLNDPFIVNDEALMCPGDPAGSDGNTINCRCVVQTNGIDPGEDIYGPDPNTSLDQMLAQSAQEAQLMGGLPY